MRKEEESGQIVILLAIALLALLMVAALAIDGGMFYSERRFAQNGADASSMGGAGYAANYLEDQHITYESFSCTSAAVINSINGAEDEALLRASSNNYIIEKNNPTTDHGVVTECVNNPSSFDKHIDVKVTITSETSTSLAHLFFPDNLVSTSVAITRIKPRRTVAFGNAIASLGSACHENDGGVNIVGNDEPIIVNGGGIFSNSCIEGSGDASITVNGAGISLVGSGVSLSGGATISAEYGITPNFTPMAIDLIEPPPDCGAGAAQDIQITGHNDGELWPGNYSQIRFSGNQLTLHPGTYCLTGEVRFSDGEVTGNGVTFYMNTSDNFTVTANAVVDISSPVSPDPFPGLLIYRNPAYDGDVSLEGGGLSYFGGTILTPSGNIDVGGNSSIKQTYSTQLIGEYVKVHGNAGVEIDFDTSLVSQVPAYLDLIK